MVDTTGAGDCFIGSLGFFLGLGFSLQESMQRASVIASGSVTVMGTQASFPRRADLAPELFAMLGCQSSSTRRSISMD